MDEKWFRSSLSLDKIVMKWEDGSQGIHNLYRLHLGVCRLEHKYRAMRVPKPKSTPVLVLWTRDWQHCDTCGKLDQSPSDTTLIGFLQILMWSGYLILLIEHLLHRVCKHAR